MEFLSRSWELFQVGGGVMYILLVCSLAVVTIFVERFMYYGNAKCLTPQALDELSRLLERRQYVEAIAYCHNNGGIVAAVAERSLLYLNGAASGSDNYTVMESEAGLAVAKLRKNINHLESIVTVAPLLGLLGTVMGMIDSFKVMNVKSGEPMAITGGVGEALVATAFGLCVAILALAAYSYFSHRLDDVITNIEEVCTLIVSKAR